MAIDKSIQSKVFKRTPSMQPTTMYPFQDNSRSQNGTTSLQTGTYCPFKVVNFLLQNQALDAGCNYDVYQECSILL